MLPATLSVGTLCTLSTQKGAIVCWQLLAGETQVSGAVSLLCSKDGVTGHAVGNARFITFIEDDIVPVMTGCHALGYAARSQAFTHQS